MPVTITGQKTITVTGTYQNFISGVGENGYVQFIPNIPSLEDTTDHVVLTIPPLIAALPGTFGGNNNSAGNGHFSILVPTTDNTELFPQGFTYTIIEKVSNMKNRTTHGVQIPSSLGSTADITTILAPYLTPQ
jgi:hypothetical protein